MKLLSLELQGFKTFLDKTKLKFTDGISAVVGPNGSGKSNISDAIRWVLGETSVKILRCSKMEDIIFNGTSLLKPRGFAEVSVAFDNSKRELNYDCDEVSVTRRYTRSGESDYLINGKTVRLKDVNELFMNTGVGRDGYSVIGQGLIDSIVSSKSEERREIFEEAAGISKYRYRKSEALSKLSGAEQNLVRLNDIMSGIEDRIKPLSEQAEKAEIYLNNERQIRELESGIFSLSIKESAELLKKYENEIDSLTSRRDSEEEKLKEIENQIDKTFEKNNKFLLDIERLRSSISLCEDGLSQKERQVSVLNNDIVHNQENILRLNSEVSELESSYDINNKNLENKSNEYAEKKQELSEYEGNLCILNNKLKEILDKIGEYESKSSDISLKLSHIENDLEEKKTKRTVTITSIEQTNLNIKNTNDSIEENNVTLLGFKKENEKFILELEEKRRKFRELSKKLESVDSKVISFETEYKELEKENAKLVGFMEDKLRRAKILEDMQKNMEGFSQSVRTIIKESKTGRLKGIHGTVSSILSVDKEYSTAIDVSLGMTAQNIVTSSEEDTKKAIYYLKENQSGRATFMPISSIKGNGIDIDSFRDMHGFIGIAKNVCEYSPEYENIVSYLLGRVVIADTLDDALKIAKKFSYRFKVVTPDGQIINSGGSLTGGSVSSRQGFLSRDSEIKLLKKEAEDYSVKIINTENKLLSLKNNGNKLIEERLKIIEELNLLKESGNNLQTSMRISESQIKSCEKVIMALENKYNNQNNDLIKLNDDLLDIEDNIKSASKELEKLRISGDGNSDEKNKLNLERDKISESIQNTRLKVISCSGELNMISSEIKHLQEEDAELRRRKLSNKDKISELANKNALISEETHKLCREIEELNNKIKLSKLEIDVLNKSRIELERTSVNLRQEEKRRSNILNDIINNLTMSENKKDMFQKKCREISDKLWNEHGLTVREAEKYEGKIEDLKESSKKLAVLKSKMKEIGPVNLGSIEEYKNVKIKYEFMKEQIRDIEKSRSDLNKLINSLTLKMQKIFSEKFEEINKNFSIMFNKLFGGGSAELSMTDSSDVLSSGIEISVRPPGKVVSRLELLSGGEKALVAISLYFAIMKVNPPPFCVLDEIEASLDDVNIERFASYLRESSEKTQFIVITHRRGTMEEADVLYGVTMQNEGISSILELNVSEFEGVS